MGLENRVKWLVTAPVGEAAGDRGMKHVFSVLILILYVGHIFL